MSETAETQDTPHRRDGARPESVDVRNPRYAGATPEDVTCILLRPIPDRRSKKSR